MFRVSVRVDARVGECRNNRFIVNGVPNIIKMVDVLPGTAADVLRSQSRVYRGQRLHSCKVS